MAYLKALLFTLVSTILIGCGASHHVREDNIYRDPDWTYADIKQNGMSIAGISSQVIQLSDEERFKYSMEISNILLEELKDAHKISITNTAQLIAKIGTSDYYSIMRTFDREKIVEKATYDLLGSAVSDNRYILFAYIENENIIDNSYEQPVENEEGVEEIETEHKKTYLLSVDFRLYDLQLEKMVWNSVIFNQAENTESRTTRSGCFESAIDALFQNILFGEPAEIDREEVLAKIADKLADGLEKADK
jgi:hypothetical protein